MPGFAKLSAMSLKRAQAASIPMEYENRLRREAWYEDLRAKGILAPGAYPTADRLWNGDEIGVGADGAKYRKVYVGDADKNVATPNKLQTSERLRPGWRVS